LTAVAAHFPAARCHLGQRRSAAAVQRRAPGALLRDAVPPGGAAVLPPGSAAASALRAGLAFLPLAAGVIVIAPSASWLVGRFGPAPTLIAGPLVFAGGLVYLSYLPVHAPTSPSCLAWSWSRP